MTTADLTNPVFTNEDRRPESTLRLPAGRMVRSARIAARPTSIA